MINENNLIKDLGDIMAPIHGIIPYVVIGTDDNISAEQISITHIYMMGSLGESFSHTFFFSDDLDNIYFSDLSVLDSERERGHARKMLNIHLTIANKLNVKSCLMVKRNSWVLSWYNRCWYDYYCDRGGEYIYLINNNPSPIIN